MLIKLYPAFTKIKHYFNLKMYRVGKQLSFISVLNAFNRVSYMQYLLQSIVLIWWPNKMSYV